MHRNAQARATGWFDAVLGGWVAIVYHHHKAAQYSAVRETTAAIYCDDETLFGPTEAPNWPENLASELASELG